MSRSTRALEDFEELNAKGVLIQRGACEKKVTEACYLEIITNLNLMLSLTQTMAERGRFNGKYFLPFSLTTRLLFCFFKIMSAGLSTLDCSLSLSKDFAEYGLQ